MDFVTPMSKYMNVICKYIFVSNKIDLLEEHLLLDSKLVRLLLLHVGSKWSATDFCLTDCGRVMSTLQLCDVIELTEHGHSLCLFHYMRWHCDSLINWCNPFL